MTDWLSRLRRLLPYDPATRNSVCRSARPRRPARRLAVEALEERTVPTTFTDPFAGVETDWLVRANGAAVEVLANGVSQGTVPAGTGNSISITGENGQNDTLTVDF